jgi:hypothetical protein
VVDHYGYPREAVAISMNILDRFSANAGLNKKLHQVRGCEGEAKTVRGWTECMFLLASATTTPMFNITLFIIANV